MKRKRPIRKPHWKEAPAPKPLSTEAKRKRREWITTYKIYLSQLLLAETERQ